MKNEQIKFTIKDWDDFMKTHQKLREEYDSIIEFIEINPSLAEMIDKECIRIIKENK